MINVLVTGSGGQLGNSIQKISKNPNYDHLQITFRDSKELDIKDPAALEAEFERGNFNFCINCAAFTDVEKAEKAPAEAFATNETGARNVALACKKHKVILVHISTDYVFDGAKTTAYTTSDEPNPINQYGRSKWAGEKQIDSILTDYYIIRTSWLYSYEGNNFYTKILEKAKKEETIYVTNDQRGCPTHAANLAQYILRLISADDYDFGIYHFTDGEVMTWFEFAKKILSENNYKTEVLPASPQSFKTIAARPKNSVLQ